jgi:hypothetical protein
MSVGEFGWETAIESLDEAVRPDTAFTPREVELTTTTAVVESSNRLRTAGLAVTRETRIYAPIGRGARARGGCRGSWTMMS